MRFHPPQRPSAALLAASLWLPLLFAGPASAREYSTEIDVTDEEELRQIYYDGLLEDDEFDILLGLIEAPIDLNRAERGDLTLLPGITETMAAAIVEERTVNGAYLLLTDIARRVDGVTLDDLRVVDAFVYLRVPLGTKPFIKGAVDLLIVKEFKGYEPVENDYPAKSRSIDQAGYGKGPTFGFAVRANVLSWLDLGFAGTAQEAIRSVEYEAASRDFYASWGTPTFRPYLAYARVTRSEGEVVVGTYHVAYGLGLVMNTIGGAERHGPLLRKSFGRSSDRIRQFDGLLGGAGRLLALRAGRLQFDLSAFGSIRDYDVYSSYIGQAGGRILDPATVETETPRVWIEGNNMRYMTIPNAIRVAIAGGNATMRFNRRTHIGLTGYAALTDRTIIPGIPDGEQNALLLRRRWPVSNNFGVIGVNGALGFGLMNLAAEWGLFLDRRAGNALRLLFEVEPAWGEFVISLRHYDTTYANPYGKSEAAPDQYGGFRARNEQGVRFTATVHPVKQVRARIRFDLSHNIALDLYDLEVKASLRGSPVKWLSLSMDGSMKNQDLARNGREFSYSGEALDAETLSPEELESYLDGCDDGPARLCDRAGEKATLTGKIQVKDKKIGSVTLVYKHAWTDNDKRVFVNDNACRVVRQEGGRFRVKALVRPHKSTTISGGFTVLDDDHRGDNGLTSSSDESPRGLTASLQISQKIKNRITLRLRGTIGRHLLDISSRCDEGGSTPGISGEYQIPADYKLHYGELLFSMRVKF
jgi:hypothetical protein